MCGGRRLGDGGLEGVWEGQWLGGRDVLAKSPLHRTRRLQPACFDQACSMWSKKPTPVHIQMCCDAVICEAWWFASCAGIGVFEAGRLSGEKWSYSGRWSIGPPSSERETWIFVSLVTRSMSAVRRGAESDIVGEVVRKGGLGRELLRQV